MMGRLYQYATSPKTSMFKLIILPLADLSSSWAWKIMSTQSEENAGKQTSCRDLGAYDI